MTGDDATALLAVLAADPERLELLAEEARLMAALNQDGTNGGHAHANGDAYPNLPAAWRETQ